MKNVIQQVLREVAQTKTAQTDAVRDITAHATKRVEVWLRGQTVMTNDKQVVE